MPSYDPYDEYAMRLAGMAGPSSIPSYDDMLAANTAARTSTTTTPGGQTFTTSDPNYSLGQYVQDAQTGNAFRKPGDVQDFATANGTPLSADALRDYTHNYNLYQQSQDSGGAWNRVGQAANFELDRMGNLATSVAHDPSRLFTGVDPASTALWNGVLGTNNQALVGQLGGATENDFNRYEQRNGPGSLGAARGMSHYGDMVAGMFGAAGAAHGLGQAYGSFGNSAPTGDDLGIFSNGGQGGMSEVGGGNAGALAARGGIQGGAGVGAGAAVTQWGDRIKDGYDLVNGANGGGGGNGGGQQQIPWNAARLGGMMGSQIQPQSSPTFIGLPIQQQQPYIPSRGYNVHDFLGAKVWT